MADQEWKGVKSLDMSTTDRCQLRCKYCFHFTDKEVCRDAVMSDEVIEASAQFLVESCRRKHDRIGFTFYGGEPTLVPDVLQKCITALEDRMGQIPEELKPEKGIKISGPSNYVHFSPEVIKLMEKYPDLSFSFSADGPSAQGIQRTFPDGTNSWDLALKNLDWMRKFRKLGKVDKRIRMTITPDSVDVLADDAQKLMKLGFKSLSVQPAFEVPGWSRHKLDVLKQQYEAIADLIIWCFKRRRQFMETTFERTFEFLGARRIRRAEQMCGAGRGMVAISTSGDIWPCHRFVGNDKEDPIWKPLYMGNVLEGNFDEGKALAWYNIDCNRDCPKDCGNCSAYPSCNPGCYYTNYQCTGDIRKAPDSWCDHKRTCHQLAWRINYELQKVKCRLWNKWLAIKFKKKDPKVKKEQMCKKCERTTDDSDCPAPQN